MLQYLRTRIALVADIVNQPAHCPLDLSLFLFLGLYLWTSRVINPAIKNSMRNIVRLMIDSHAKEQKLRLHVNGHYN